MLTAELPYCPKCAYDDVRGWTCHDAPGCPIRPLPDTRAPYEDADGNIFVALGLSALLWGVLVLLAWGLKGIVW